jgi:apolipoprotein N-acyltransferase
MRVAVSRRWSSGAALRGVGAIVVGAALYAIALPPFDFTAAAWFVLVPLLLVVRGRSMTSGFLHGLFLGAASGSTVTWYAAQSAAHYFGMPLILAVLALWAYYTIAVGTAFGIFGAGAAVLQRPGRGLPPAVTLPALWAGTELVRGRFLDQPWGLLGYTQYTHSGLIQVAEVTGIYGVSFLIAVASVAVANAIIRLGQGAGFLSAGRALAPAVAVIAAVWIGGAFTARGPIGGFGGRRVAIVQTNLAPAFEWTRAYSERQLLAHIRATEEVSRSGRPALVVWPENAVTRYLEAEPLLAAQLGHLASRHGADLLFGAPRHEDGHNYNSAYLITAEGRLGGIYDKRQLVPFAESTPLVGAPVSAGETPRSYAPGTSPGVLQSFLPLGVSICHEILYPELIADGVRAGAQLLVSVANDGWMDGGHGIASQQAFAMAVFRAVETRRYLVRAATTGVSGVVDPYGRVLASLGPGKSGVVVASVAGRRGLTPYVRFGDAFAFACAGVAIAAVVRRLTVLTARRLRLRPAPAASVTS